MTEENIFQKALSNFTYEAASGGAIRHLTNLGYTVKQITERLSFPTPYEKVQKTVWEQLLDTGVLLLEEPGNKIQREKVSYVKEYGKYGKSSFRRITDKIVDMEPVYWKEKCFRRERDGNLASYLKMKCDENEPGAAYVFCDFGVRIKREKIKFMELLQVLNEHQRDYISGLPWEDRGVYHKLDLRMREIVVKLYENDGYHGSCYFIKTKEKLVL